MNRKFIYRNAGAGGEGGPTPTLTISDLDDDSILGPDSAKDDEGDNGEGKNDPPEETEDERKAREGAEKLETEKIEKVEDAVDAPKEETDEAELFFADVDELRGDTIEVEYGEVDPMSPEGVVLRERAVEDQAIENFENYLEAKYPKAYGYLMHTMAGKPEEDFFKGASDLQELPSVEELEASLDIQKNVFTADLIDRGNSEKQAALIIKQAIEDNELEEMAKEALLRREGRNKETLNKIKVENDNAIELKQAKVTEMNTYVDEVVTAGKIGSIVIPPKDRVAFAQHFKESIRYDNGKFVLVSELTQENIEKNFGKEYFAYKNGNLGSIVEMAAKTENARRLKRTMPMVTTPKGGSEDRSRVVTLGEIDTE